MDQIDKRGYSEKSRQSEWLLIKVLNLADGVSLEFSRAVGSRRWCAPDETRWPKRTTWIKEEAKKERRGEERIREGGRQKEDNARTSKEKEEKNRGIRREE